MQRQHYNAALEERIDRHRKTGRRRTCLDRCRALTKCCRDVPVTADFPVAIQRGTLRRLDEAPGMAQPHGEAFALATSTDP